MDAGALTIDLSQATEELVRGFEKVRFPQTRKGLSLIEVVIAMAIIGVLAIPIYGLFSGSAKFTASSRHVTTALTLANSYLTVLESQDSTVFYETGTVPDKSLPGPLSLEQLDLEETQQEYQRTLKILKKSFSDSPAQFWLLIVTVSWKSPINGQERSLVFQRVLEGPAT